MAAAKELVEKQQQEQEQQQLQAAEKSRSRRSTSPPAAERSSKVSWVLSGVMEQRVLKTGLLRLHRMICSDGQAGVLELPSCADGSAKVVQGKNFLLRLLGDQLEFKSCSQSDVSAAQADLRHLSSEQLLRIRAQTLDFATQSASHSAHLNFLEMVDR